MILLPETSTSLEWLVTSGALRSNPRAVATANVLTCRPTLCGRALSCPTLSERSGAAPARAQNGIRLFIWRPT